MAVDPPGHLLALKVTPASQPDREPVKEWARAVRQVTTLVRVGRAVAPLGAGSRTIVTTLTSYYH